MQKTDLDKFHSTPLDTSSKHTEGEFARTAGPTVKTVFGMMWKTVKTVLFITMLTGLIVFISVASYILSIKDKVVPPDIGNMSLTYTSFVHIDDGSGTGQTKKYLELHGASENRVWVDLKDIPQHMKDAMVAIEDKRFYEHKGVDWFTTFGAVGRMIGSGDGRGGSTLTQQLIKNITEDDDVSILRKVREIFMALKLEEDYSKDDILEAYLNVVNFGGNTMGVQAAANLYFGKNIIDCDIAECASIAGITQYPYLYTPLYFPENNRERQELVLDEMHDQQLITASEYNEAKTKAENMPFVNYTDEAEETETKSVNTIWNWYIETMIYDITGDLMEYYNCSREIAQSYLYNLGLEIYCSMDEKMQEGVEDLFQNPDNLPWDLEIQYGVFAMDYTGKTLAVVGSRQNKAGNMVSNYATRSTRQSGSSIKPLSVYAIGFENGNITYGSVLKDEKLENYFSDTGKAGPENFSRSNEGYMNLDKAIRISQNMPAAQLVNEMGVETSYNFLVDKLHLDNLDREHDMSLGPLALGGFYRGTTVRELTAGFQIFGNGGKYNKPYTYYYVKDHDNNVILDNREKPGEYAISEENAAVMNQLLHGPVYDSGGTASLVQIEGIDMFGKTGTSDSAYDLTFAGGTPFAVAGVWNGYADRQVSLEDPDTAKVMWRALMEYLHSNYSFDVEKGGFYLSQNVVTKTYCRNSGIIAGANCYNTAQGLYANVDGGIPKTCNGGSDHVHGSKSGSSKEETEASSSSSSASSPSTGEGSSEQVSPLPSTIPSESSGGDASPPPLPSEVPVESLAPIPSAEPPVSSAPEPEPAPSEPEIFIPDVP